MQAAVNKKIFYILILVAQCTISLSSERRVIKYNQYYNPLVCAVLENKYWKVFALLRKGSYDPHEKTIYGYTLRHLAQSRSINRLLLKEGVAAREEQEIVTFSAELCMIDPDYVGNAVAVYRSSPEEFKSSEYAGCRAISIVNERDPSGRDVYDKFPEAYTYAQRKELAGYVKGNNYAK